MTAILELFPRDITAGVLSIRFLNLLRAAYASLDQDVREPVDLWAPHVFNIVAWVDPKGSFNGRGVTLVSSRRTPALHS